MDRKEIYDGIISILENIKHGVDINTSSALLGESLLDSLEFMNYLSKIELTFKIKISDSDISKYQLGNVKNMLDYLLSHLQ